MCGVTVLGTMFLNGNISIGTYFPPLGKILNPHKGFWQNAETNFTDIVLESEFISDEIKIIYDERYVPHIYAQNMGDVLFAQGYLEAQNRLFQMDIMSRSVSGKLSEVIGNNQAVFKKDIESIHKGHRTTAALLLAEFEKGDDNSFLKNYEKGANHFIDKLAKKDFPFEYKLMDFAPSAWSVEKSIYVLLSMADLLSGRADDFENNNLRAILDEESFNYLYADNFNIKAPVIPPGTPYAYKANYDTFDETMNSYGKVFKTDYNPNRIFGAGSNNWAIAGKKSATGMPILANDPHLGLSLPSIWYELQVHTPEFHAHGVSVPGLAGMMIGFNENVAWGMTNVSHDIKDFYKIHYTDSTKLNYKYGDSKRKITKKKETIKRRGDSDYTLEIAYTDWGPIMYSNDTTDIAMHWLRAHQADQKEPRIFVDCMRSSSYDDFVQKTSGYIAPAQNFICADRSNIGIRVNGKFAAKKRGDGMFVKHGNMPEAGWNAYVPIDQLPHIKNPERGYVSSANQRSTAGDYPYYYNGTFATYRGERINAMLDIEEKHDVESFKRMQLDDYNLKAKSFLPLFLESIERTSYPKLQSLLKTWNYSFEKDSKAATLFYIWYGNYKKLIFDEFSTHRDAIYLRYPSDWKIHDLSMQKPDHTIFDVQSTAEIENRNDIIQQSFIQSCEDYSSRTNTEWSSYRPLFIDHIAKISGLGSGALQVGGSGESLNATRSRFGPSWRMVVALGEETEAYGVYPGGQSGNPASKFYKNMLESWANGEYYKIRLENKPDKINAIRKVNIKPGK